MVELLRIANGHLPRVRLEYDRFKGEMNSLKAEIINSVRIYQQFCDRNVALKKREDELRLSITDLEVRRAELQKIRPNDEPNENEILHSLSPLNESSSETLYVPHVQDGLSLLGEGNHKILDSG